MSERSLAAVKAHLPTAHTKRRSKVAVPEQVDVAIVGAGTGGLMAGAYLARAGLKVAVFDSHYVAGGSATMFSRGSGSDRFVFDIGLHYIGDCHEGGILQRVLADVGLDLPMEPMDKDGFDTLIFPDFRFRVPAGQAAYRQALLDAFPAEKRGIERYMKLLRQTELVTSRIFEQYGRMSLGTLLRILFKSPLVARYEKATLGSFIDSCTRDIKLKAVIAGLHGDYGLPPGEIAALFHAGLMNHYLNSGAYYPVGGGQAISDALAETIEGHGGVVALRRGVERILVESGRAVGLRLVDGLGEVRARAVISGADIKQTWLRLVEREHVPAKLVKQVKGWSMPASLFMTCLAVEDDLPALGIGKSNYWTVDDYDLDALYQRSRGQDQPMIQGTYITSGTVKDPGHAFHAPAGIHTLEVMTLVDGNPRTWGVTEEEMWGTAYQRNPAYLERKERLEAELIERLEATFPGATKNIVFRESSSPMSQVRYTRASGGAGYGIAMTPQQFNKRRPGARTGIGGMYLVGSSTRANHGIIGTMQSGRIAAWELCKDLGIPLIR